MGQHTPGPWETSNDAVPDYHTQITVYAVSGGERVATVFQNDANAHLIAAAPELLEALLPFARLAEELPTGPDWKLDDKFVWGFDSADVVLGDFRRVTVAIAKTETFYPRG